MVLPRHCKMPAWRHCGRATAKMPPCYWIWAPEWTLSARAATKHSGIRASSSLKPLDADPALDDNGPGPWLVPGPGPLSRVGRREVRDAQSAFEVHRGIGGDRVGAGIFEAGRCDHRKRVSHRFEGCSGENTVGRTRSPPMPRWT